MECLLIRLQAPLMSWGGNLIDSSQTRNRRFPTLSMVTGMLGNALGLERHDHRLLQRLQDGITMATRIDREPAWPDLEDFQTARIAAGDQGWTTRGQPEGRRGDPSKYRSPNISHRHYLQDAIATVALTINNDAQCVGELAEALQRPFRPLYIGRRPCLPATDLYAGAKDADSPLAALLDTPLFWTDPAQPEVRLQWTAAQRHKAAPVTARRREATWDMRDWRSRLHGGHRRVIAGTAPARAFPTNPEETE